MTSSTTSTTISTLTGIHLGKPPVYEDHYTFDQKVLLPKLQGLAEATEGFDKKFRHIEIGAAGTTAVGGYHEWQPHLWPELQDYIAWARPRVSRILGEWGYRYQRMGVSNSWANRHRKGGWTNWHCHGNVQVSTAAYISAPPNSGNLIMADPLETSWSSAILTRHESGRQGFSLPAETNRVYFFPGWLKHSTEPNETDQDRWVLSVNFCVHATRPILT